MCPYSLHLFDLAQRVADIAVDNAEQRDDRGLVGRDRMEIAHCASLGMFDERQRNDAEHGKRQIWQKHERLSQDTDQSLWMTIPAVPDFTPSRKNLEGS